jgi:hypothetical protein
MKHKMGKVKSRRRGSALAEFAVISPLLFSLLFGIVEYGYVYMVRQTMTNAARDACRLGVIKSSTEEMVINRVAELMAPTGISVYSATYTKGLESDPVDRVDLSVHYEDITLLPGFFADYIGDISVTCSMRQEGVDVAEE